MRDGEAKLLPLPVAAVKLLGDMGVLVGDGGTSREVQNFSSSNLPIFIPKSRTRGAPVQSLACNRASILGPGGRVKMGQRACGATVTEKR